MRTLGIDIGGTSVKVALLDGAAVLWTARSSRYEFPTREQLIGAISECAAGKETDVDAVGICLPGKYDREKRLVEMSVNIPSLNGLRVEYLVNAALGVRARAE